MSGKTGNYILIGMILGIVIGAFGGYFYSDIFLQLGFLGTIFINALKMVVIPLIISSMIVGVTSMGDIRKLSRTAGKTVLYFLATTGIAVLIGIVLVNIIRPGDGIGSIGIFGGNIPEAVSQSKPAGLSDMLVSLIPSNLFEAAARGEVLPLIIFSLIFGGVLTAIGAKGKPVIDFFVGLNTAIMKIVVLIIYFAPIGIIGLIGSVVAENRGSLQEVISGLGLYCLTIIIGLIIHAVIVLPLILKFLAKKDPLQYFINMGQALATAFTTASSSATLPVTMDAVIEKNKINSRASSFVLPLGATINTDGTALYEAVAAIFIAQAINFPLAIDAQIVIFLVATLASIGAAAIPHAGLVTMVMVLTSVGLPLEGIGFILVVDWFIDRCRTTVNVWGDSVGAAVIGETEEIRGYRIDDSKLPLSSAKRKYEGPKKAWGDSETVPKVDDRKQIKRTRVGDGPRSSDRTRYQKSKDSRQKPRGHVPSLESGKQPEKQPDYRGKKPYVKPDGTKPMRKTEPAQFSKKTIEEDLEKVHRHLTSMGTAKESGDKTDNLAIKAKSEAVPVNPAETQKDEFFDKGVPKFDFFGDDKSKKDENISTEETPASTEHKEPVLPNIPIISAPSDIDVSTPKSLAYKEEKDETGLSDKTKETGEPVSEKKDDDKDPGWGRDKKKRLSK